MQGQFEFIALGFGLRNLQRFDTAWKTDSNSGRPRHVNIEGTCDRAETWWDHATPSFKREAAAGVTSKHWDRLELHLLAEENFLTDSQLLCPESLPKAQNLSVTIGQVPKRSIQGKRFCDSHLSCGAFPAHAVLLHFVEKRLRDQYQHCRDLHQKQSAPRRAQALTACQEQGYRAP